MLNLTKCDESLYLIQYPCGCLLQRLDRDGTASFQISYVTLECPTYAPWCWINNISNVSSQNYHLIIRSTSEKTSSSIAMHCLSPCSLCQSIVVKEQENSRSSQTSALEPLSKLIAIYREAIAVAWAFRGALTALPQDFQKGSPSTSFQQLKTVCEIMRTGDAAEESLFVLENVVISILGSMRLYKNERKAYRLENSHAMNEA